MKITHDLLIKKRACKEAIKEFDAYEGDKNLIPLLEEMIAKNKLDWANWLITTCMSHRQQIAYAIYAARQTLKIFEKQSPNDKRPHLGIKAAENYIKNPCKRNRNAAWAAGNAAWAAGDAAWAAGDDATKAAILKTILNYGITILRGEYDQNNVL